MSSARRQSLLPAYPSDKAVSRSQKFALKKEILLWLHDNELGWSQNAVDSVGTEFVAALTDVLWYLDGHASTLSSRACSMPQLFERFSGFNQPSKSKHRKRDPDNLSAAVLDSHSNILNGFALHPWLNSVSWKEVSSAVCTLAEALHKYAEYLNQKNLEVQGNHEKRVPVRSVGDAESYMFIPKSTWMKPADASKLQPLQSKLDAVEPFEPVFVNDFAPTNQRCVVWCCVLVCLSGVQ